MNWINELKTLVLEADKRETIQQRISANVAKIKAHKGTRTPEIEALRRKTMEMITKGKAMETSPKKSSPER
jgi:hypothetical protein